ncbi:uncharacterized protein LOC113235025 [Hyposmocoma kahamanoa]|uniref:uncharacterized protein LOC113235025 n=1 Tax=Hyposmocoma kahamanoa TaxID=1477025 RepID=UPI000E6D81DA|nr:uncharacterized protein LOC113235025 [Hyposmocoma kahamanoa]
MDISNEKPNVSSDQNDIKIVARGRGKVLLYNGHQYYFHVRYKNNNCLWRCKNYKTFNCTGSVTITQDQSKLVQQRQHSENCLPDENENIMCIITSSSLDRAASNVEETVPAVYRTTIASMKDTGLHLIKKLPTYNKYKCKAYRRRRKLAGVEKMAYNDMKEVEVPPDDFLLADYRDGNDRILIFALKEAREIVLNGKVFLCDGTFKNCLKPFYELYVLFCDIGSTANENNVIPVIYALLPNKKQKTYLIIVWHEEGTGTNNMQSFSTLARYRWTGIKLHDATALSGAQFC